MSMSELAYAEIAYQQMIQTQQGEKTPDVERHFVEFLGYTKKEANILLEKLKKKYKK